MTDVVVKPANDEPGFSVEVRDDNGSSTTHLVTVSDAEWDRYGGGYETPQELVAESFAFLLEREPKESILRLFQLGVIARYFPDYASMFSER